MRIQLKSIFHILLFTAVNYKSKHMNKIFIFFILFTGFSSRIVGQSWTEKLDATLSVLEKDSLFDGQVLIAEKNNILFHKSYGNLDDSGFNNDIKDNTPLVVYSVSKSFTALAIMQLMEQGLLGYDTLISDYFPNLPYNKVTISNLLTMTSGLPRFLEIALKHADTSQIYKNTKIVDLAEKQLNSEVQPNQYFSYNNTNYILLALIVEKVSGVSFKDYLNDHIFKPANMFNSEETISEKVETVSSTTVTADNFYQPYGIGSVKTTALDLHYYVNALFSYKLISKETLDEALKCQPLSNGEFSNYGFSWRINDCENPNEIYLVGDGTNMRASLQYFPQTKRTLIYLHANSNIYHEKVYWVVRHIWEGKPYELPVKRKTYKIDRSLFAKYVGSYKSNFGLLHISESDGKLYLRPDTIPGKEELVPISDTKFYFKGQNLEWKFYLDANGEVIGFGMNGDKQNMGIKQK